MSAPSPFEYALFYETDECLEMVRICATEEDAARQAAAIEVYTDGTAYGVQRSDGALEPCKTWALFLNIRQEMHDQEMEMFSKARQVELRTIVNPFTAEEIRIERDEYPEWVGKRG